MNVDQSNNNNPPNNDNVQIVNLFEPVTLRVMNVDHNGLMTVEIVNDKNTQDDEYVEKCDPVIETYEERKARMYRVRKQICTISIAIVVIVVVVTVIVYSILHR